MDSILEVIFAFLFAGAIAEWRRRRELRSIEKILRDHYSEKEDKSVSADSTVSTLKWLMSSDVRLAVRLERLRKKKAETELRLLRQREEAALKLAEAERRREEKAARRAEFRSKL